MAQVRKYKSTSIYYDPPPMNTEIYVKNTLNKCHDKLSKLSDKFLKICLLIDMLHILDLMFFGDTLKKLATKTAT